MEHVRLLRTGSVMDDLTAYARDEKVRFIVLGVSRCAASFNVLLGS